MVEMWRYEHQTWPATFYSCFLAGACNFQSSNTEFYISISSPTLEFM